MAKDNEISPYTTQESSDQPMNRNSVRDVLLSELNHFRNSMRAFWGGFGKSAVGNLFGFFLERGYGLMFRNSPLNTDTVKNSGLDYGRIFLEDANDTSRNTPSWSIDLPKYSQKLLFKSECSSLNYKTQTGNFTAGLYVTGGTSGAKARIVEDYDEGTEGTLVVDQVSGTFVAGETITDTSTGSATLDKNNVGFINAIVRLYGVGGKEVGGNGIFKRWGAFDLFCPMRLMEWTVGSGTGTADPELIPGFAQEGFMYSRNNAGTRSLRIYQNAAWKTVTVT